MARNQYVPGQSNWERYFSANRSEAQEQAERMRKEAERRAKSAQDAANRLASDFATKSGQVRSPKPVQPTNVGSATTVASVPGQVYAKPTYAQPPPGGYGAQNLAGTPPSDPSVLAEAGNTTSDRGETGPYRSPEELEKMASEALYTGPSGASELEGYGEADRLAAEAQRELDLLGSDVGLQTLVQRDGQNLTSGESAFSSALAGAAGNRDFELLRRRFSPRSDLDRVKEESVTAAERLTEAGKATSEKLKADADRERKRLAEEAKLREEERKRKEAEEEERKRKEEEEAIKAAQNAARAENDYSSYKQQMNNGGSHWKEGNEYDVGEKAYMLMSKEEWDELMRLSQEHNARGYWGNLWASTKIGGDPNDAFKAFVRQMKEKYQ